MYLQGKCVMNRRDIIYNTPECEDFRANFDKCMTDNNLGLNNKIYSPECKKFCDENKYICDVKKNDICDRNVLNNTCDDDTLLDFTDLNSNDEAYPSSINRRKGFAYGMDIFNISKKYVDIYERHNGNMSKIRNDTDKYLNMYKFNFCLNKNRKANRNCEKYINSKIRSKPFYLEECKTNANMDNMLCKQFMETRPDDYRNYIEEFCLDKNNEKGIGSQVYKGAVCRNIRYRSKIKIALIILWKNCVNMINFLNI